MIIITASTFYPYVQYTQSVINTVSVCNTCYGIVNDYFFKKDNSSNITDKNNSTDVNEKDKNPNIELSDNKSSPSINVENNGNIKADWIIIKSDK